MLCFNVALLYFFVLFKPATAVQITNTEFNGIQTGSPFTITWTDNSGPVTILLRMGNSTDLTKLDAKAIWVDLPGTSFVWIPQPILQTGPYRLELADSAVEPVYSPQFQLTKVPWTTTYSAAATSTTSQTSAATSQSSNSQPLTSSSSTITPTSITTLIPNPTAAANSPQTSSPSKPRLDLPVKIGVIIALLFTVCATIYFIFALLRHRLKKKLSENPPQNPSVSGDGVVHKNTDLEHGRGAEMSGALDSAVSISNGVSSPTTDISSRRPSTRPSTGPTIEEEIMGEVLQQEPVEIGSSEQGPVEIGSSGYGKEMSEPEKIKAVEMEANQRIRFEERKGRRRGVRLMVGGMKIWF